MCRMRKNYFLHEKLNIKELAARIHGGEFLVKKIDILIN